MMLRGDFHMHTWRSKDCGTPPKSLVKRALKVGLSCIAVTDHNEVDGALEVRDLAPPELKVIVAEEIKTPYGEITGFFLRERIPPGLGPVETCRAIKEQGGLVSIPHPYDRVRNSPLDEDQVSGILPYIDIVEVFNARTTLERDNERAKAFATEHGFAMGAGSDAHCTLELGAVAVVMPPFEGPDGFLASLREASITGRRSSPLVHLGVDGQQSALEVPALHPAQLGRRPAGGREARVFRIGLFATGRGQGSLQLVTAVRDAIEQGRLPARVEFVFSNREPGEFEPTDRFFEAVRGFGYPLVTRSFRRFKASLGDDTDGWRMKYDHEVIERLAPYEPDLCVLAGYLLIFSPALCERYTAINLHPAAPGGPIGMWQDVIWRLIETKASASGNMMQSVTPEVDRGPIVSFSTFPIAGGSFEPLWDEVRGRSVEELRESAGEALRCSKRFERRGRPASGCWWWRRCEPSLRAGCASMAGR